MTDKNCTESYAYSNQAGRDYADNLYRAVQQGLGASEFAAQMRTLFERGQYAAFEIGFAFRLHNLLLTTDPVFRMRGSAE